MSGAGSLKLDYFEERVLQAIQTLGPLTEAELFERMKERAIKYGRYQGSFSEKHAKSTVRSLIKKKLVGKASMLVAL